MRMTLREMDGQTMPVVDSETLLGEDIRWVMRCLVLQVVEVSGGLQA